MSEYNPIQFSLLDPTDRPPLERSGADSLHAGPLGRGRLMLLSLLAASPLLVWSAWSWGRRDAALTIAARPFQVNGGSMAPTLLGEFEIAKCDACELLWYVDAAAAQRMPSSMSCSHCGDRLHLLDQKRIDDGAARQGPQLVAIDEVNPETTAFNRGDLVAIKWENQLHVKRIAALPGDSVDLDRLHVIINGKRLEDLLARQELSYGLPRFLVDHDAHRKTSRWSPIDANSPWQRLSIGQWRIAESDDSPWLVYHHQSVHDQNRPSPVWDDYPFNAALERKLFSVDRLSLEGEIRCDSTWKLEVAFWSSRGNVAANVASVGNQPFAVSYYDGIAADGLPVTAETPVAVRVVGHPVTLAGLSIQRLIEYRIRPHDDRGPYPLRVGAGQCFVLGDNVPVSLDSRDVGPVPIVNVVGIVTGRGNETSKSGPR